MVDVLSVTGSVTGLVVYAGIENRHLGLQTLYTPGVPPVPEASTTYSIYCKSLTGILALQVLRLWIVSFCEADRRTVHTV